MESHIREILLIAGCYIRNFKKGNYIYEENEIIRSIGLILSGHVYMIREDLWGEKDILVSMGRGKYSEKILPVLLILLLLSLFMPRRKRKCFYPL